jgi:hypothetical protein
LEVRQAPVHDLLVQVTIVGLHGPGRTFEQPDGSVLDNVHVGVQVRRDPWELVPGDVTHVEWTVDVDVVERDGDVDFRGPVVQGRRGDRFLYLTWGDVDPDGRFEMFRRAKLMLGRVDTALLARARDGAGLVARVDLTDDRGGPRCARLDPPVIEWSAAAG